MFIQFQMQSEELAVSKIITANEKVTFDRMHRSLMSVKGKKLGRCVLTAASDFALVMLSEPNMDLSRCNPFLALF